MSGSPSRRVVITGFGVVSPLGNSREKLGEALRAGRSGIDRWQSIPSDALPCAYGAECRDFTGHIDDFGPLDKEMKKTIRKGLKVMCREIQMGVAVAQLALVDAGLAPGSHDPDRIGVVYGCDYLMTVPEEYSDGIRNCLDSQGEFQFTDWAVKGLPKVDPLWLLKFLPNMPASHIAIYNDFRGPNNSLTVREASSNIAVGEAYMTIVRGHADAIVAGATGSRVHPMKTVQIFLEEQAARGDDPTQLALPFNLHRTGCVLGEGAGALMLEARETAEKRGAKILGEVLGCGSSTVTDQQGRPNYETAVRNVIQAALRSSGLKPSDIGHVHAHGLGTRDCDAGEAKAIHSVFGEVAVPVTAAKSYFGNLGAAGGMVETICSLLAVNDGPLFPVLNFTTPDPECPVHVVRTRDVPAGDVFLNINVTPQGQASAIVVRKA